MPFATALLAIPLVLSQLGNANDVVSRAGRVGISLDRRGDVLVVSEVEPGSSAETVGLEIGDQILRIDLSNAERLSPSDAAAQLRGALGTRATLTVLPRAEMLPRRVDVLRDVRVYLANEDNRVARNEAGTSASLESTPASGTTARRALDASLVEVTSGGKPAGAEVAAAFAKSPADVATCVGALADVLPEGFPSEFAADVIVKRGSVIVRTEPPSGDLASCLGRKASAWGLPQPGRKDPPIETRATWRWVERPAR